MSVNLDHGAGYGNTLTWTDRDKPKGDARQVEIQVDLDNDRFNRMFIALMTGPTPPAH
jgi:purine nucleosidase